MHVEEKKSVKEMWQSYLSSINEKVDLSKIEYEAWHFSDNNQDALKLSKLVMEGKKKATSSLHSLYILEGEDLPVENELSIILDGDGEAQCVIKTKKVVLVPFNEVTESFAESEGEGDLSLEYWRNVHKDFFSRGLKVHGKEFTEDMMVVCEEFELVFPK